MKNYLTHENVCRIHKALKNIRFVQFGFKVYPHYNKNVPRVRSEWSKFQKDPLNFLATSPEGVSRDVLSLLAA